MYINIPKPTDATYVNINKAFNDQSLYGSAIYGLSKYGVQQNYTNIAKPSAGSYTNIPKPT